MAPFNIEYDAVSDLSYGSWRCPVCKAEFYGGGPAAHNVGCGIPGYVGCTYRYTTKEKALLDAGEEPPCGPGGLRYIYQTTT